MELEKLKALLEGTGLPVTYLAWPEGQAPALPFLCYLAKDTDCLYADGEVYYTYDYVVVELYTEYKSPVAEQTVEQALKGYHWKKSQDYLKSEKCFITIYEIEV